MKDSKKGAPNVDIPKIPPIHDSDESIHVEPSKPTPTPKPPKH